jgi:superoxide dismutase, Fe-Mn family
MMFKLPDLPYDYDALSPVISAETMRFHHDKHHAKYVDTLNDLLKAAGETPAALEDVVKAAAGDPAKKKLFNNAAQTYNHTFFWTCMIGEKQSPQGDLAAAIDRNFGGLDKLKEAFVTESVNHFASGWGWLAAEGDKLKVLSTHDADDLLTHQGLTPLLTCDVWEHAYYLDHQNDRKAFVEAWFDNLPHWTFAAAQYDAARGKGQAWRHPVPTS